MSNDIIDYQRAEAEERAREYQEDDLQESIQRCARRLNDGSRSDYAFVARVLGDPNRGILARLVDLMDHPLDECTPENGGEGWYWPALEEFRDDPEAIHDALESGDRRHASHAKTVIERTLSTAARLAEQVGVVKGRYTKTADGVGWGERKIGEVYKDPKMPFGDPVELIVERGTIKTLHSGGTNTGKSTGTETTFENYYERNFVDGEPATKCIDPVDTSVAENIFYDVPQSDGSLRKAREDMDLPPDFTEDDTRPDPQQETLVPLSPVLGESRTKVPYDIEDEEFVATPFIIPASTISPDLFISVVTARVTDSIKNALRQIYESVDRERSDWSLQHLAEEIADRGDLSDRQQQEAILVVQALQDTGFIRQSSPEYELDWDRILRDTETITVFNQLYCQHDWERKFVLAWILEQLWERRTDPIRYPQMALMFRELWDYAPKGSRDSDSDLEAAIQERITSLLARFMRMNRDVRTHIVADTQNPDDLNIEIRSQFNRYCLFESVQKYADLMCQWTGNEKSKSFANNITVDVGECGIVGAAGPPTKHPHVEYVAPVAMAPPSHHHHDKDDGNGFRTRADLVETEEIRVPRREDDLEWPVEVPQSLKIDAEELLEDEEEDEDGDEGDDGIDVEPKEFHRREARNRRANGESYREIRSNIPENPETGNNYSLSTISNWTEDIDPNADGDDAEDSAAATGD